MRPAYTRIIAIALTATLAGSIGFGLGAASRYVTNASYAAQVLSTQERREARIYTPDNIACIDPHGDWHMIRACALRVDTADTEQEARELCNKVSRSVWAETNRCAAFLLADAKRQSTE